MQLWVKDQEEFLDLYCSFYDCYNNYEVFDGNNQGEYYDYNNWYQQPSYGYGDEYQYEYNQGYTTYNDAYYNYYNEGYTSYNDAY